ncbi:MerR family transcriptional regulator [uncultured Clostridium sp.]|uniref:MerR family transcriptional regulator n=1 Tax=uncultured Clostridium sp. TaxID=59620 RepID=UPI0025E6658E|nr:MerR family transcriptional regulator [uncultured Clostridium sp.]
MKLSISETARLCGVSVRTLHYYDEIGLLKPDEISESGYRYYGRKSLEILQQILFYKELQFPLKEISKIMNHPHYDRKQALIRQKELLILKEKRIKSLIKLVDESLKGEVNMSFKEFGVNEIENAKKKYAEEAEKLYGNTEEYKESIKKEQSYSKEDKERINVESALIMKEFSLCRELDPGDEKVQKLVRKWQNHITKYYYKCSKEILQGLGQMYVNDERFKKNIDKNGEGTAALMAAAIEIYCSR